MHRSSCSCVSHSKRQSKLLTRPVLQRLASCNAEEREHKRRQVQQAGQITNADCDTPGARQRDILFLVALFTFSCRLQVLGEPPFGRPLCGAGIGSESAGPGQVLIAGRGSRACAACGSRFTRARDVAEHPGAAEPALRMQAVGPTSEMAHLATLVPEEGSLGLNTSCPGAAAAGRRHGARARDVLERARLAEAALGVDAIGHAAEHARLALMLPIVRHKGLVREGASVARRARDVCVAPLTAKTTPNVDAIGETTAHAFAALRIPEVRGLRLVHEGARSCGWPRHNIRACDVCVRVLTAEAALCVDAVCPAAQLPHLALVVPVVRHNRLVGEMATRWRARDAGVCARSTEPALNVLAIGIAPQHAHRARWIPEVTRNNRLVLEFASSCRSGCCRPARR